MRLGPALLALLLAVALCGCASEKEQYCEELSTSKDKLADLAAGSGKPGEDALDETLEVFGDLREAAPGDIEDEWTTLVFAYENLAEAFDAAGTTPAGYDPASPPEGVTDAEAKRIEGAAAELASGRVLGAADDLQQHARDVCGVDLGLSTGTP